MQNFVVYNFKELSNHQTDELKFQELGSVVLNIDISLTKTIHQKKSREVKTLACLP